MIILLSKIILEIIVEKNNLSFGTGLFYHNNSIFIFVNAITLFMIFKQIELNRNIKRIVTYISPSVFSVYLIHEKPSVRHIIWNSKLNNFLLESNFDNYCIFVIINGISIFILGIITDKLFPAILFRAINDITKNKKLRILCEKYNEIIDI